MRKAGGLESAGRGNDHHRSRSNARRVGLHHNGGLATSLLMSPPAGRRQIHVYDIAPLHRSLQRRLTFRERLVTKLIPRRNLRSELGINVCNANRGYGPVRPLGQRRHCDTEVVINRIGYWANWPKLVCLLVANDLDLDRCSTHCAAPFPLGLRRRVVTLCVHHGSKSQSNTGPALAK